MNRAQRRAAGHHRPRPGTLDGIPVFDATFVGVVHLDVGRGDDTRVMLGIGPEGRAPVAYVALCPCEGVDGLIEDLRLAGDDARPFHPSHGGEYRGSWLAEGGS
jgi:hypothetical protein